jgi:hypothetical protein
MFVITVEHIVICCKVLLKKINEEADSYSQTMRVNNQLRIQHAQKQQEVLEKVQKQ